MRCCDDIRLNIIRQQDFLATIRLFDWDSVQVLVVRSASRSVGSTALRRASDARFLDEKCDRSGRGTLASLSMQRLRRAAFPLALGAALAVATAVFVGSSAAELENLVFTSREARLRMIVPRNWRASDQTSYPGLVLWMARSDPQPGQIQLTVERFTRELYCSWPRSCQVSREGLPSRYACALRATLEAKRLRVEAVQAGPKENESAGLPSIWFDYDDGKHFLRQAIAFSPDDYAISLVLSAGSKEARATHGRAFEQALRTLHVVTAEETARAEGIDAPVAPPSDASIIDSTALADGAVLDAGVVFESAPAPKVNPIGPCDKR
jgi:hypothetical protein